jgi:GPH family glycoside/pentoside/hexuronide:cation symporter
MEAMAALDHTASATRPTLRTKVGYGFGSVAMGVSVVGLSGAMIQIYLNQVVGLPALLVGSLIMMSLMVDAVVDPLIGHWSDRTRTRWGRRHPFMYAAAIPAGIFYYLLWNAPSGLSMTMMAAFSVSMLIAARVTLSLYSIPSDALTPELTPSYDGRTTLISYRWFFGTLGGGAIVVLLNEVLLRPGAKGGGGILNQQGYGAFGLLASVVIVIAILVCAIGTHDRIPSLPTASSRRVDFADTLRDLRITLTNRSLVALLLGGVLGGVGGGVSLGLSIYMYTHLWGLDPAQIGLVVPMGYLGSIIAVFIAPALARRFGKKTAMIGLFSASVLTAGGPIFLRAIGLMVPNNSPWLLPILVVDAMVGATFAVVGYILVGSMMSDVVEDVAVKTGVRSEGLLFATNGLLSKFTGGIGAFLAGLILTIVHFPPHALRGTVSPELMHHLSLIYLPVTVFFSVVSIAVLGLYRIDRQTHERNLDTLRGVASIAEVDPFSEAVGDPAPVSVGGVSPARLGTL